jgi:hypothetical protein
MRGEVALLTRNIVIKGDGTDDWGGQVLTADSIELSTTGNSVFRYGETVLEYVEIYNCSHRDTERSALRWEDNYDSYGRAIGVSVHGSLGFGLLVKNSKNVQVEDLIIAGARQFGMALEGTRNVTVDRALISNV